MPLDLFENSVTSHDSNESPVSMITNFTFNVCLFICFRSRHTVDPPEKLRTHTSACSTGVTVKIPAQIEWQSRKTVTWNIFGLWFVVPSRSWQSKSTVQEEHIQMVRSNPTDFFFFGFESTQVARQLGRRSSIGHTTTFIPASKTLGVH